MAREQWPTESKARVRVQLRRYRAREFNVPLDTIVKLAAGLDLSVAALCDAAKISRALGSASKVLIRRPLAVALANDHFPKSAESIAVCHLSRKGSSA